MKHSFGIGELILQHLFQIKIMEATVPILMLIVLFLFAWLIQLVVKIWFYSYFVKLKADGIVPKDKFLPAPETPRILQQLQRLSLFK